MHFVATVVDEIVLITAYPGYSAEAAGGSEVVITYGGDSELGKNRIGENREQ